MVAGREVAGTDEEAGAAALPSHTHHLGEPLLHPEPASDRRDDGGLGVREALPRGHAAALGRLRNARGRRVRRPCAGVHVCCEAEAEVEGDFLVFEAEDGSLEGLFLCFEERVGRVGLAVGRLRAGERVLAALDLGAEGRELRGLRVRRAERGRERETGKEGEEDGGRRTRERRSEGRGRRQTPAAANYLLLDLGLVVLEGAEDLGGHFCVCVRARLRQGQRRRTMEED